MRSGTCGDRREGVASLITGFSGWLAKHVDEFEDLGVRPTIALELGRTLDAWTAGFHIEHFDTEACRAMGWQLAYSDLVDAAGHVADLVFQLVRSERLAGVAEDFVQHLSNAESRTEAAWFLEMARWQEAGLFSRVTGEALMTEAEAASRTEQTILYLRATSAQDGVHFDEEDAEIMRDAGRSHRRESLRVKSETIVALVRDEHALRRALTIVKASDLFDSGATYWQDLQQVLTLGD